jgi:DNA-binding transcriptional ArsR family regulator
MTGVKFVRLLADETRLRILALLLRTPDLCVCELVAVLRLPQYQISRQLGPLRRTGLLTATRRGPFVFYGLAQEARAHPVYGVLLRAVPQLVDGKVGGNDAGRMKRLMKLETSARSSACEAAPAATTLRQRPILRVLRSRQAV